VTATELSYSQFATGLHVLKQCYKHCQEATIKCISNTLPQLKIIFWAILASCGKVFLEHSWTTPETARTYQLYQQT